MSSESAPLSPIEIGIRIGIEIDIRTSIRNYGDIIFATASNERPVELLDFSVEESQGEASEEENGSDQQ